MAIRELSTVLVPNVETSPSNNIFAGDAVVRDPSSSYAVAYDRSTYQRSAFIGLSADDRALVGQTLIIADPVGANIIDDTVSGGPNEGFRAYNNALYVIYKRAIPTYLDETATTLANPTEAALAGGNGVGFPMRPLSVYQNGGQFVTDRYARSTNNKPMKTDGVGALGTDIEFDNDDTFKPGDLLVAGTGSNAGRYVKLNDDSVKLVRASGRQVNIGGTVTTPATLPGVSASPVVTGGTPSAAFSAEYEVISNYSDATYLSNLAIARVVKWEPRAGISGLLTIELL